MPFIARLRRSLPLLLITLAALLSGCATLPPLTPSQLSAAIAPSMDTLLGRVALSSTPTPELTGFRLLPSGAFALDTRLALIQRAQRSLDLQYYLVQNDDTGRLLLRALRDAAQRGVRVRLLVDDLYTAGEDELLLGLQANPNVEVRLFNPFPGGRSGLASRIATSLADLSRVNHRMHNKLFIADGAMAVAGGRNIADEYFSRGSVDNFIDLDAFMVGGAVWQLQRLFDDYWNSPFVYPMQAIAYSDLSATELRQRFDALTAGAALEPLPPDVRDILGNPPLSADIDGGWLPLIWSRAAPYADPPDKIIGGTTQYAGVPLQDVQSVRFEVLEQVARARQEVFIDSPYLIPGEKGVNLFRAAAARGVRVSLLTNSLASTDEPLVAMGYRRYREPLLDAGVQLYELSPTQIRRSGAFKSLRDSIGRLHAKTAVIDRRMVFIGSMNFDGRSASVNTEMGVFVDSPQLAEEMLRLMTMERRVAALQLARTPDGRLQWNVLGDDGLPEAHPEPGADPLQLLWWKLLSPLAPEELL